MKSSWMHGVVMLCAVWVMGAEGGVKMVVQERALAGSEGSQQIEVLMEGDRLRMDASPQGHAPMSVIFLGERKVMVTVDHGGKQYTEMTEKSFEQAGSQMDAMRAEMEKQLAGIPAEQRAMVEQMMKAQMGGAGPGRGAAAPSRPKTEVKRSGETRKEEGYTCRRYDVYRGREKVSEVWAADWSEVKISRGDVGAMYAMGKFQEKMLESLGSSGHVKEAQEGLAAYEEIDGIPVVVRSFENGTAMREARLTKLEKASLAGHEFDMPGGYKRVEMPGIPARR